MKYFLSIILLLSSSFTVLAQGYKEKAVQVIPTQVFYLNSVSHLLVGGNTRHVVSLVLPPNTVKWYYAFAASRNKVDVQNVQKTFNLLSKLTYTFDGTGVTADIVSLLGKPPGSDYCDVYLFQSGKDVNIFRQREDVNNGIPFYSISEGSAEGLVSGTIEVKNPYYTHGIQYLGFRNNHPTNGVNINLQVVAIVREEITTNGWDKQTKQALFDNFKTAMIKSGAYKYMNNEELESLISCMLEKVMKKYSPNEIQALAKFEISQLLQADVKSCDSALHLNLEKRMKQE